MTYTIYSRDGCPYCVKIQQVLELAELDYEVHKLGENFSREEFYKKFGHGSTFPRVVLGEELLGGCSETVNYLREQKLV